MKEGITRDERRRDDARKSTSIVNRRNISTNSKTSHCEEKPVEFEPKTGAILTTSSCAQKIRPTKLWPERKEEKTEKIRERERMTIIISNC